MTNPGHATRDDAVHIREATVVLPNKLGLHARSAASLLKTSARFQSSVVLYHKDGKANARSLTELLRLGARQGDAVRIQVQGPDADVALHAVQTLLENGFGEE
jgi:phosphotransferase system HPr (HPr) family protein